MKSQSRLKRVIETLIVFIIIGAVTFGFLSLCNWSYHLQEWTGFSRFLLGVIGLIFIVKLFDDL